jgi:hypothetical protein
MHLKKGASHSVQLNLSEPRKAHSFSLVAGVERAVDARFVLERGSSCRRFPLLSGPRLDMVYLCSIVYNNGVLRLGTRFVFIRRNLEERVQFLVPTRCICTPQHGYF